MNSSKTLVFAYDAGSANVTMAHAYKLASKGLHVEAYPKGPAIQIYKKNIPELIQKKPIFSKDDTVIVGTSGIHSDYEMRILKKAKNIGVTKTIVILDSIDKMETRFVLENTPLDTSFYPDEIWTPKIPLDIKVPKTKIIKIDDPYLEFIHSNLYKNPPKATHALIKRFQSKYLVILSEYVKELFGNRFGFNEIDSIKHILDTIDSTTPILLKTHPAEPTNKYDKLINSSHLNIHSFKGDIHELVYHAKVIVGINSSVFYETIFLKKPTFSIQIGSIEKMDDILPIDKIIYDKKTLTNMLNYHFGKGERE